MKLIDNFSTFQLLQKEKPATNANNYRMSYIDAKQNDES